jgi:peptidoglycan hydrolase CwlO-like protein
MGSKPITRIANQISSSLFRVLLATLIALSGCQFFCVAQPDNSQLAWAESEDETVQPTTVRADTTPVANELQQRVEETAAAYNQSLLSLEDIQQQIKDNQTQLDEIGIQLEAQKEKSSEAAAEFYRMHRTTNILLELLFSSQSLSDLALKLEYVNRLQGGYFNEIKRLNSLNTQLTDARSALEEAYSEAQAATVRSEEALADAKEAREEARLRAEAEAAAQALAANLPIASPSVQPGQPGGENGGGAGEGGGSSNSGGSDNGSENGNGNGSGDLSDRESFVAHWGARIDAYYGSYPLAGYGKDFAGAAWDYGVDPRVAPAISCIESGSGRSCFKPHNAWGWGNIGWPDWPTAIAQYTAGFSRGYGYTITLEGAKRYVATDNYPNWYAIVIGEMNKI